MRFRAVHRFARISPTKVRPTIDLIRGKPVDQALEVLAFTPTRGASFISKVLRSAVANAGLDTDAEDLWVETARVDAGPTWPPRWKSGGRGRAMPRRKHTSHLIIELNDGQEQEGAA